ncbi:MAG: D-aminoacyl-tRNA deacylase [Bryobacteraceae bacterium]
MRAVLQRVTAARVEVNGQVIGAIQSGLVVLLGIAQTDRERDAIWLANKVAALRVFDGEDGRMNRSILDAGGSLLIVPQFTLYADIRKGSRPGFDRAAKPDTARGLYEFFIERARLTGLTVQTGIFQASMAVYLVNDGPVTLICDSPSPV